MESAVDAQSLITISMRKIHSSRTQRGGIKLHKNLLVSYVLRNARQLYMDEKYAEMYRNQQYEEVMAVCNEIQQLVPHSLDGDSDEGYCGNEPILGGAPLSERHSGSAAHSTAPGCFAPSEPRVEVYKEFDVCQSCCEESYLSNCDISHANIHCNQTTVLDLDTHLVTTVENGHPHLDCCAHTQQCVRDAQASKRKIDATYVYDIEDSTNLRHCKRARTELSGIHSERMDTANISNLISIFGSGVSGLVNKQTDWEQILNRQLCSKHALPGSESWTRAIEAF